MNTPSARTPVALFFAVLLTACGGGVEAPADTSDGVSLTEGLTDTEGPDDVLDAETDGDVSAPDPHGPSCDPLMPSACTLPWPSNKFLVEDASRKTGYRLQFGDDSLPANTEGWNVDPAPYQRLDGYGVGTSIIVHFPDLSLTGLPLENTIHASLEPSCPVGLFKVSPQGLQRVPSFVELDQHYDHVDRQALYLRPAVLLEEETRYVVAFHSLVDSSGAPMEPSEAFRALRDGTADGDLSDRVARFEEIFALLVGTGVSRDELILAWDFVTASSEAMHGDLLHMRDRAFEISGEDGPELTITTIEEHSVEENEHIALSMEGTFSAPVFVEPLDGGHPVKWTMPRDETGAPKHVGYEDFKVWIRVPHVALEGEPVGLIQYGHGLNGEGSQVKGSFNSQIAQEHGYIFFACDWEGMSEKDLDYITVMLADLSGFEQMANRLHQGMINPLLLARAMRLRFPGLEEVTSRGIAIDTDRLHYSGISQGGIYGATYMALTQDILHGHLGVPGQNYALLMPRSIDFIPFFAVVKLVYPDGIDRAVLLNTLQLLWDSVDPSSHLRHIKADPHPDTPPHEVLLTSATGDYQVALLSNEIAVRSDIGIALLENYGKAVDGVDESPYPVMGSGLVNYSFGNPWAEMTNLPPEQDELGEPHGKPRKLAHHMLQKVHFLETGEIIDVCGGDGCTPD